MHREDDSAGDKIAFRSLPILSPAADLIHGRSRVQVKTRRRARTCTIEMISATFQLSGDRERVGPARPKLIDRSGTNEKGVKLGQSETVASRHESS